MRGLLKRLITWATFEEPVVIESWKQAREMAKGDLYKYLMDRTEKRDQLFKDIESAVLGRNYTEALKLAREGWGLRGR